MTPIQFQALALAWLASLTVVASAVFMLCRFLLQEWLKLRSQATEHEKASAALQVRTEALDRAVNGQMTLRIESGAQAAIQADKVKEASPHE